MTAKSPTTIDTTNVLTFPRPPRKLPLDQAGPFAVAIWTDTVPIGPTPCGLGTLYRKELVVVDPDAPLEDYCLVVFQFTGGFPHWTTLRRSDRDDKGRFLPKRSRGYWWITDFGMIISIRRSDVIRILGRVVDRPPIRTQSA